MKILVFVKQVPDTPDVKLDPKTGNLNREGVESIIVGALVSDERVALETGTLVTADMTDMAALYQALNAINADATFVRFVLNTNDGSIIARMELPVLGDEDFGYVVERCMLAAASAVDDSYNALAALA